MSMKPAGITNSERKDRSIRLWGGLHEHWPFLCLCFVALVYCARAYRELLPCPDQEICVISQSAGSLIWNKGMFVF